MKDRSKAMAAAMAAIAEYLEMEKVTLPPPGPGRWKLSARREMAQRRDPPPLRGREQWMRHER